MVPLGTEEPKMTRIGVVGTFVFHRQNAKNTRIASFDTLLETGQILIYRVSTGSDVSLGIRAAQLWCAVG